jgi:hypothetical protein
VVTVNTVLGCVGKIFHFAAKLGQKYLLKLVDHFIGLGAVGKLGKLQCRSSDITVT